VEPSSIETARKLRSKFGKNQLAQHPKPHDHPMPFRFAEWAQERFFEDDHFYRKIVFSDEAHFHLGGYVNKQNYRISGSENPHVVLEMLRLTNKKFVLKNINSLFFFYSDFKKQIFPGPPFIT